jgi:hypothetical protein
VPAVQSFEVAFPFLVKMKGHPILLCKNQERREIDGVERKN